MTSIHPSHAALNFMEKLREFADSEDFPLISRQSVSNRVTQHQGLEQVISYMLTQKSSDLIASAEQFMADMHSALVNPKVKLVMEREILCDFRWQAFLFKKGMQVDELDFFLDLFIKSSDIVLTMDFLKELPELIPTVISKHLVHKSPLARLSNFGMQKLVENIIGYCDIDPKLQEQLVNTLANTLKAYHDCFSQIDDTRQKMMIHTIRRSLPERYWMELLELIPFAKENMLTSSDAALVEEEEMTVTSFKINYGNFATKWKRLLMASEVRTLLDCVEEAINEVKPLDIYEVYIRHQGEHATMLVKSRDKIPAAVWSRILDEMAAYWSETIKHKHPSGQEMAAALRAACISQAMEDKSTSNKKMKI